ncbi:3-hydroxyacyl-CoA dehydrogenase NAD-binding domain-containing protein [Rhizobium sp. L1K21]|uniref:3-hydroxyacyl-CoA dehydrogenase NAD-binding domain-containing protein n=1 Tax=Rhizobium sp. L1K21 TaxID=2954933 RepID=UPI00209318DD|nr:3-hydroxyacyl-CoA dehydrogenase NAD-binding domain-containing protein [Rhizobium sp. L1K21]MCO6187730.1 3-hydroxyacyl-CoA dehydrogenase NAD-binding domain-containing protein [Rhizobium sp. L1K21]
MNKPVLDIIGKTKLELGPAEKQNFGNWWLGRDDDNVAWAIVDKKNARANTLSQDVLADLEKVLDALETSLPKALMIRSAKSGGFIAGADIGEFRQVTDPAQVEERLRKGHAILDRLEALSCPTIAVVHGYALGGGFELALACDHRVAVTGASFGFPEVRLGLHPGLGGTFRLTELIDPIEAMTMMLTGKTAHTQKAKSLGIVEVITEERHVRAAIAALVKKRPGGRSRGLKAMAFNLETARQLAARQMSAKVEEKAPREHYPAPHELIDIWVEHGHNRKKMQEAEINSFARLLLSDTAQNLIRVFFLREKLKANSGGKSSVAHVHVVGAGTMGAEIAAVCAMKGLTVSLSDPDHQALGRAVKKAGKIASDAHLSGIQVRDVLDRLMPDPKQYGLARADLVIEAAPEKVELKKELLASIEARAPGHAIIATNTSSLELPELVSALRAPERFAGLHFFNPVSKLELVEVVSHPGSSAKTLADLNAFVGAIDHLAVPVKSYPGFLVNRILTPYLLEAAILLEEGHEPELIDRVAQEFGMAMGPLEVADRVGLDICLHVAKSLRDNLDTPVADIPAKLKEKVDAGHLGEKTGRGIYKWKDGKPEKSGVGGEAPEYMEDRLILPMLNAAVECLREKVVSDSDTLDAAMIFASGFAPFLGGPIHYAKTRGTDYVIETLTTLEDVYGPRFKPDEGWKELGK